MGSTLVNVWDDIQGIVDELVPEGRAAPKYRMLEGQADQQGAGLHRRYWYEWTLSDIASDRGLELSEVEHTFELKMQFDFQRYQKKSFERAILNEITNIWRAIESNDSWGTGVRSVQVDSINKEVIENNDAILSVTITSMCDET